MTQPIEEIFTPDTVTNVEEFIAFLVEQIRQRGGDPSTVQALDTATAIPNVKFSEEWPCLTLSFDLVK